jgi:DNA-binding MarR family transcriptional regulator
VHPQPLDLVRHLARTGYLTLEPDPLDGGARLVHPTVRGKRLQRSAREAARSAELRFEETLGPQRLAAFKAMRASVTRSAGRGDD